MLETGFKFQVGGSIVLLLYRNKIYNQSRFCLETDFGQSPGLTDVIFFVGLTKVAVLGVCVSLFYVIDTGSIRPRPGARIRVTDSHASRVCFAHWQLPHCPERQPAVVLDGFQN
jgi:hypothetical protein